MKVNSQAVTLSLVTLLTLSIFALSGCQDAAAPAAEESSETTVESSTEGEEKTEEAKTEETATKEVKTPEGAKDMTNTDVGGMKVVTYNTEAAVDASCEAQAAMVADAGWKASETMPDPVKTTGAWTQIFENGKMMLTLACAENPTAAGTTVVTMTQTENVLAE